MKFKNKVALVTGASSGIGRVTALLFAQKGAKVIVSDVNEIGGKETVAQIKSAGGEAIFIACDVSDKKAVTELFELTISKYDRLDFLINNAGLGGTLEFTHEYPDDIYDQIIAVNQTGVFYCMKAGLQILLEQGAGGSVVNVSSVAGISAAPKMSAYAASKHAVIGLTKTAAAEYGKHNIRVNAVCPTVIETPMGDSFKESHEAILEMIKASIPMKRFGQPEEVASVIVWLCSEESSFVNGQELKIDGGMRA